jgi:hypothetical protein
MWKPEHHRAADGHGQRYTSDLSDSERAGIEPAIPPAKRLVSSRLVPRRQPQRARLGWRRAAVETRNHATLFHAVKIQMNPG